MKNFTPVHSKLVDELLERMTDADKELLLSWRGKEIGTVSNILADRLDAKSWVHDMTGFPRALLDVFLIIDNAEEEVE